MHLKAKIVYVSRQHAKNGNSRDKPSLKLVTNVVIKAQHFLFKQECLRIS
jgi:hypothetical protein